jgi:uncharacterized protein
MNRKELPVIKEVVQSLGKLYGNRLSKIFLYGSYARGKQNSNSDIDFLVMLKDKNVSPYSEIDFYTDEMLRLSDKYNIDISVKATSENFFENKYNLFAKFVKQEGKLIFNF